MKRRTLILASLALVARGRSPRPASAAGILAFDRKTFGAAQEGGESIVVFVHAPW
jgi:hypothetical protein